MDYPFLFSEITVRGHIYRNRIIAGPTLFALAAFMTDIGENVYRMCESRAAGGAAEVTTGELTITNEGVLRMCNVQVELEVYEGKAFEGLREYAGRIKKHGAVALLEICHEGTAADRWTESDMVKACKVFKKIALYARMAGFDGILLHGGHGFLIQQFVSPLFNRRRDQYGGSAANRARFPLMIFAALREGLGEDGILELRFSAEDGEPDGMTINDTVEFCRLIDGKVDIIHLSNGQKMKGNRTHTFTDMYDAHGYNIPFAAKVKKAVKLSKVAVVGGINSPELAEEALAAGSCDFVVLARQAFADPEFANKAAAGKSNLIRRCIRCFQCYPGGPEHETDDGALLGFRPGDDPPDMSALANLTGDPSFFEAQDPYAAMLEALDKPEKLNPAAMGRCSINPKAHFKLYPELFPLPKASRKLLVVGGGPAGMQAAITASERGHRVILVEKSGYLGGTLNFAKNDPDKADLANFIKTLEAELELSGAAVLLHTSADEFLIKNIKPDYVLLAVGARAKMPDIPGIKNAVPVLAIYDQPDRLGERVVIAGGGLSACEAAIFLAGRGKKVTVIARRNKLAPESAGMQRTSMLDEMELRGVKQLLGYRLLEIEREGVLVSSEHHGRQTIAADSVVVALGEEAKAEEVSVLAGVCEACGIPWSAAGDCVTPGKVGDAIRAGYMKAMQIF